MTSATTRQGEDTARRVAEAALTVVARDGFDVLSVRTVAREAGVSAGTVQHHYANRAQLVQAAFERTVDDITERLVATDLSGSIHMVLGRLCREVLPLDEQRRRECVVWAALSAAAASHPELGEHHRRAIDALTDVLAELITASRSRGELPASVDSSTAATILVATVDGLTLHGITASRTHAALTATLEATIAYVLQEPIRRAAQ